MPIVKKDNHYSLARHQTSVRRAVHSLKQLVSSRFVHKTHNQLSFVCFYFRPTEVMTNAQSSEQHDVSGALVLDSVIQYIFYIRRSNDGPVFNCSPQLKHAWKSEDKFHASRTQSSDEDILASLSDRFSLGKKRAISISKEAFIVPGPVWMLGRRERTFFLLGIKLPDVVTPVFFQNTKERK